MFGWVIRKAQALIEAPGNGGRNDKGPKVAKFSVGEVPNVQEGVNMATPF